MVNGIGEQVRIDLPTVACSLEDGIVDAVAAEPVLTIARVPNPDPKRLLLLFSDTGGGHRAAARALVQTLNEWYPGEFEPVMFDPLGGPNSAWLLRRISGLYGFSIRFAPWVWGSIYYSSDSRLGVRFLRSTLLALANRPVAEAVAAGRPAAIVNLHPLTGSAAVKARERGCRETPVLTVVTDLVNPHSSWHDRKADRIVVPPTAVGWARRPKRLGPERRVEIGLPVSPPFAGGVLRGVQRAALRRSLGLDERRFTVLLTGGGEGAGGIARRAKAILRRFDDVAVVAICGRNRRLREALDELAAEYPDRLKVNGFVDNMAEWLRCADVLVSKAGPGTIAEATCCGVPLMLTSHVPGQERGNTEFVVDAGAGRHTPSVRSLLRTIDELHRDQSTVDAMALASARLGQPEAAREIAALLAGLLGITPPCPSVPEQGAPRDLAS
ncbi:MAG TPA: glycosyltransferase [Pseudonocardiaceae bacterium]|nr:glycosyltransferase [Pseudonocardiaceae bacterium]